MAVVPLTLTISLCLVFTFVLFFLREYSRQRFSSAESEALLPLAEEIPQLADGPDSHAHHRDGRPCGCSTGVRPPCVGCRRQLHG